MPHFDYRSRCALALPLSILLWQLSCGYATAQLAQQSTDVRSAMFHAPKSPGERYFSGVRQASAAPPPQTSASVEPAAFADGYDDSQLDGASTYPDSGCNQEWYGNDSYASSCGDGMCYTSDCCDPVNCGPCRRVPCVTGYVDWLYLQVTDADVAHAQQQNGIGGAGTVPFGDIGTVEQDFNSGVRTGIAFACNECASIGASYTYYESDAANSLNPPFIEGGGGAVGSLVHHPGAAITASSGPLNAAYEVDFQLADLVYRHVWLQNNCYSLHYLVGAQFGHLEQGFTQSGNFSGGSAGTIDTSTNIDFDGGGLKVGVDGERRIGGGFLAYGRLTAAALSGRFRSQYDMINSTTDVLLAEANWDDDRVISQVEYELGIGWTNCSECFRVSTGYMFSHWGNVVTTSELIDAVQADNYTDVGDTISFDGLVMRVEFRY